MNDQDTAFTIAYGEAMFFAHLIEDLVAIHLSECRYYHVNGYTRLTIAEIRGLKHEKRIDELKEVYKGDAVITEYLISSLHLLRKIRNHVAHAFVTEVGSELRTEEGVDQAIAMLENITFWERIHLQSLRKAHEALLNAALKGRLESVLQRDDAPFEARVARSKIQAYLDKLSAGPVSESV